VFCEVILQLLTIIFKTSRGSRTENCGQFADNVADNAADNVQALRQFSLSGIAGFSEVA
jgi:hypothetical protein